MSFQVCLEDFCEVYSEIYDIREAIDNSVQNVETAITTLCDLGWSGEARDVYLGNVLSWSIRVRNVLNEMSAFKGCLFSNLSPVNTLLQDGKALTI